MSNIHTMDSGEQNTTLYSSPYMAEFYELHYAHGLGLEDVELVYWPAFVELFSKHPRDGRQFTFVDIGTGGGRAILGLLDKAVAESFEIPPGSAQFIGMDIEQHMLDCAARGASKHPGIAPVTWSLGSALALDELPALADQKTTADMLIFTYGSIVHLTGDGDLEKFFGQVSRVLTPGSGRAYVDFADQFFVPHGQEMPASQDDMLSEMPVEFRTAELKSIQWPGITYRMETLGLAMVGNACVMDTRVRAVKDADEAVVESSTVKHRMRLHEEDQVQAASRAAGLLLLEKKRCNQNSVFVFQKTP
ncbi:hypothetical protein GTR04_4719 [Trichophyton interdigitale]|uniref:Methyltransferase domain-containing protein n=1 Tax=Trichophyton interdigitale TaxID=101480 RepID=A0A9P4YF76_9EURO|nr:hypothetical protein GY631_3637 [Trichophyton interdigitale]KAF3894293.1 hypothetical protein GY632_3832 [Trichophyton interdigitale]KAG8207912.1 hypothetical protein GTR04_4719 [Trichophyton interdigitale]